MIEVVHQLSLNRAALAAWAVSTSPRPKNAGTGLGFSKRELDEPKK